MKTVPNPHTRGEVLRQALALVEPRLQRVEAFIAQQLEGGPPAIQQSGTYVLKSGGKRLRPALLLLVSRLLGYSGDKDVRYAALVEMIHTATLVHDDIIDHASLRRGRASANSRWGNQLTVLLGDWLYTRSMELALEVDDLEIMRLLSRATMEMIEGEVLGLTLKGRTDVSLAQYLDIARRKTAELFAAACAIPSLFSPDFSHFRQVLSEYGRNLGLCFQIVDDLLDLTGNEDMLGKPVFSDLREGKLTLPLILALPKFDQEQRRAVEEVANSGGFGQLLHPRQLREWLNAVDALSEARQFAVRFGERAAFLAAQLPAGFEQTALVAAPWFVLERNH
ncbi:MAG: polyprenyl synthetase family protein [Thermoanaerobaculum sp.]|nr:polyprenyl synthetase family protein [Thermoanaerobaculum sp.]